MNIPVLNSDLGQRLLEGLMDQRELQWHPIKQHIHFKIIEHGVESIYFKTHIQAKNLKCEVITLNK
uniref:Uncharacterized protein n=1 Tax=Rhizophora mucronata TaxID=61149 RepID=A0A2P2MP28_RHIMU